MNPLFTERFTYRLAKLKNKAEISSRFMQIYVKHHNNNTLQMK